MNVIEQFEKDQIAKLTAERGVPEFNPGDTLRVQVKVVEGTRERLQADYYAVKTIEERTREERFVKGFAAPAGQMHLTEQQSPAQAPSNPPPPAP